MTEQEPRPEAEEQGDLLLQEARRIAFRTPLGFLAFGFGSGLLTRAPGTMGTLAALPVAIWLQSETGRWEFWFLAAAFLAGIPICEYATKKLGVEDYGGVVWDEMVGFWFATAWLPAHPLWLIPACVLFRFFDIIKPWPISALEERYDGGFGIMVDDLAAGVYTAVLMAGLNVAFFDAA